jgi:uncharacterized membrane protein
MFHLFHPALVHFAVAFLIGGGLCEAWGLLGRRPAVERFGGTLVLIGTISLVPVLFSGYLAANSVDLTAQGAEVLGVHETTAWLISAVFVAALFWKGWCRGEIPATQRRFYALLLLAAVLLTGYGALLGGELVYVHAVGVR